MANSVLEFGPYNSKEDSKREYEAKDIGRMFEGIITDGVSPYIGKHFKIERDEGLNIKVNTGKAFFNRTWNYLENPMLFRLKNGDSQNPRYDVIVLRIGCSELVRENVILVKTGTPSSNPVPPKLEIHESSQYEYALGYIYVPVNANSIENDNQITNLVGNDSDPNAFYKPGEFAEFAYAVSSNKNIGKILVPITKDDSKWAELPATGGGNYYKRSITINNGGITNDAIVSMDLWTEGVNITEIQKKESSYGYIFRHEIRDNILTLYAYYRPEIEFTIRFIGTGITNS